MQRLEVSGTVRLIYRLLGVKGLINKYIEMHGQQNIKKKSCRLSTLLWFGSCNHCISACFLWSENLQHSSSNHGLCCFSSYRPTLCLAGVLICSLMSSQPLFMSLLSFNFSICCLHLSKMRMVKRQRGISANKSWFRSICCIPQEISSRVCQPTYRETELTYTAYHQMAKLWTMFKIQSWQSYKIMTIFNIIGIFWFRKRVAIRDRWPNLTL